MPKNNFHGDILHKQKSEMTKGVNIFSRMRVRECIICGEEAVAEEDKVRPIHFPHPPPPQ